MFKSIDPEVAGGLGEDTILDTTVHPPIVYQLHYEFQGWLRNDILESFPCFIVTNALKEAILNAHLSGVAFDYVKVTTSYEFRQLYPAATLPPFNWMAPLPSPTHNSVGQRVTEGTFFPERLHPHQL